VDGSTGGVRVVLDVWRTCDGRIDGALQWDGAPDRTFSGVLELLALLEDVLTAAPA
jgi:hypothetical protein